MMLDRFVAWGSNEFAATAKIESHYNKRVTLYF